jgi:hypothetical protein
MALDGGDAAASVRGDDDVEPLMLQDCLDCVADRFVVVDDDNT